jgi:hypothetical protein
VHYDYSPVRTVSTYYSDYPSYYRSYYYWSEQFEKTKKWLKLWGNEKAGFINIQPSNIGRYNIWYFYFKVIKLASFIFYISRNYFN